MSSVPTVYLVRHGETEWSKGGRHTGRTDVPLTLAGEGDAYRVRDRLSGVSFQNALSSPLARATRTAEVAGFVPVRDLDLLEWDYGEYEGLTSAEIIARQPGWLLFRDGCPGGESPGDVATRVDRLVTRLKALTGNVVCFAHGHLLRVLAARWVNQPVTFASNLLLSTGSLSVLAFDHESPDEPAIRTWNS